jgi:hypothetical protein
VSASSAGTGTATVTNRGMAETCERRGPRRRYGSESMARTFFRSSQASRL